jgi:hypothetical protein
MHRRVSRPTVVAVAAVVASISLGGIAHAQYWPDRPVTFAGGRVLLAGDASGTFGSDDPGWFTYTDYETESLRRVRAGVTIEARPSRRLSFLAEIRAETGAGVVPYAWYMRVSPLENDVLDIQAGRIPPVFGTYARRSYPQDNPLIGDPLGYQYLTSARPDAVPANANQLLAMRGHGWLVRYPVGSAAAEPGVPVVAAGRWDTGVEVRVGTPRLEGAVAYTVGTLSYPLVRDDNHGRQLAGRVVWRPVPAFAIGASAAQGAFISHDVLTAGADIPDERYDQRAVGIDGEASWGRWLLRGEIVTNSWRLPPLDQPRITDPLGAVTGYLEAKIRMGPRLYVAARGDQLRFSTIQGTAGAATWDANVARVEVGVGYRLRRGLLVKASMMNNWRDGGRIRQSRLAAAQALFWF